MKIYLFILLITFQANIVTSQNAGRHERTRSNPNTIPMPRFRHQLNRIRDISMPPSLLPNAFSRNNMQSNTDSPMLTNNAILLNNPFRTIVGDIENRITNVQTDATRARSRPQYLFSNSIIDTKETRNQHSQQSRTTDRNSNNIIDGPIPILRSDMSLRQQETLPPTFDMLGILPTDFSIENPSPGSRIQLDRTLDGANRNQNVQIGPQQNGGLTESTQLQRTNNFQGQANFLDTLPLRSTSQQTGFEGMPGNFQRHEGATMLPEWSLPLRLQHESLQQQFNNFQNPRQSFFPSTFPVSRSRNSVASSFNNGPIISPFRSRWAPIVPSIPLALNIVPFLSVADNSDTDDAFVFANSFLPRSQRFGHFSTFTNRRFVQFPDFPFNTFNTGDTAFGFPFQPGSRRRTTQSNRPQSTFLTTSSLQSQFPTIISTPPSVQTTSVLPPPSAFFAPAFRDDDYYPFMQYPFYNPYMFDTFLSDFRENPQNGTRSEPSDHAHSDRPHSEVAPSEQRGSSSVQKQNGSSDIVRPFYKDKAERIKMSRSLGTHNPYNDDRQHWIESNLLEKQATTTNNKGTSFWYRDIKPF